MPAPNGISRRTFIKAGSAFAAPYFVPRFALGGGLPAPSERITMGLIGVGNMGGGHVGTFLGHDDVQIVAICDVDVLKRDKAIERVHEHYAGHRDKGTFHGCDGYHEFEALLDRNDIDAVLIAVPDHWHAIIAVAAARAGKDIYCEKPLSLTVREAREMVLAARRHGRVFQTGSQQRSSDEFHKACSMVRSGRIGRLQTVDVNIGPPSRDRYFPVEPVRDGFDWDRWLGPAPWAPYNAERCSGDYSGGWRRVRDYSGGMTTDWGAHHFDIGQWGIGADDTGPVEITPPDEPDGYGLRFLYANGVTMTRSEKANGVLFTGTEGRIEVNRGHFQTWPEAIGAEPLAAHERVLYKSPGHQADWLECIRTRRRPICDVEVGCRSVTVCHLGNIACWLGRKIRWDPTKEEIIGDPEAARWLDRPKRAPWRL
jgi:predicted dehydrogenase